MKIIALTGIGGAGKTTFADMIVNTLDGRAVYSERISFAGPLRDAARELGITKGGDTDPLYRQLLQDIGSTLRSSSYMPPLTGPNYFTNLMRIRLADAPDNGVYIIDDARFPNELKMLKESFDVVHLHIDPSNRLGPLDELVKRESWRNHESEAMAVAIDLGLLGLPDACMPDGYVHSDPPLDIVQKRVNVWLGNMRPSLIEAMDANDFVRLWENACDEVG